MTTGAETAPAAVLSATVSGSFNSLISDAIAHTIKIMTSRLGDPALDLSELAAEAGYSVYYFSREFKRITGSAPMSYLAALRRERAKELLRSTKLRVTQIAEMVGYGSSSSFSAMFRKGTGMSPIKYRESAGQAPTV